MNLYKIEIKTCSQKISKMNAQIANILNKLSKIMMMNGEPMKARAYKKAEETILQMPIEIKTIDDLKGKPGMGKTMTKTIKEFLETGKNEIIEREETNPENVLCDVYGIGPKKAKELVESNITTIEQLREQQHEVLNDVQRKGLKYYEDILKRIPRSEIDIYKTTFKKVFDKKAPKDAKFEIVGSYRRNMESSGDIDVIITSGSQNVFEDFLDELVKKKIIVEILSRGKTKCLVISKIPQSSVYRRTDFLFAKPEEYPFATLYFTGSKGVNTVMRSRALKMGYTLNEHGLSHMIKRDGKWVKGDLVKHDFPDEQSIFAFLKLDYKTPEERIDTSSLF